MKINFKHPKLRNEKLGNLKAINDKCRAVRLKAGGSCGIKKY